MKRLAKLLIRLYPPAWRDRYGCEFEALVEETNATWRHIPDILLEAIKMRLSTLNYRFTAAMALLGLVVATGISLQLPERYVSSATLRVIPTRPGNPLQGFIEASQLVGNITSRTALSNVILSPDLKLYDDERRTKGLETVIANMKADDLRVVAASDGTLTVSFQGKSPTEAAGTVRHIVASLQADHGRRLDVLQAPGLPPKPASLSRRALVLTGLLGGLLLAGLLALIRQAPKASLTASLGLALLTAATWLLPVPYEATTAVLFDSAKTRTALMSDPASLAADLQNQARILGGRPRSFYGLDLQPEAIPLLLTIRARHTDPNIALDLVQIAITRFIDKSPGLHVANPPVVPVSPMGRQICEVLLAASLALALLSCGVFVFDNPRSQLTLQPI